MRFLDSIDVTGKVKASKQAENVGEAVLLEADGCIPSSFVRGSSWRYVLTFDAETFVTDPAGALTYSEGCSLHRPVSNPLDVLDTGSWGMSDAMYRDCYYATINGAGDILHVLDPDDLSKSIEGTDVSSEITTENVCWVIPKRYVRRNSAGILHSSSANDGTAGAHTFGDHTFNNIAIGVYPGTIVGSKLMSVSGVTPTNFMTRAQFRTAAQANGTNWHLMNFHEYQLMRDMAGLFPTKTFDVQRGLGQGIVSGGSQADPKFAINGSNNTAGLFAGSVQNGTTPVKSLVENLWGNIWQFVDDIQLDVVRTVVDGDVTLYYQDVYAGHNLLPDDNLSSKTLIASIPLTEARATSFGSLYSTAIDTSDVAWGLPANVTGGNAVGLCDAHFVNGAAGRNFLVGGHSIDGWIAGLSALNLGASLSRSHWIFGSRLAFAFD